LNLYEPQEIGSDENNSLGENMPLSRWFKEREKGRESVPSAKKEMPEGIWSRCASCNQIIYQVELNENLKVCPKCSFHFRLKAHEWIEILTDEESFREWDASLAAVDQLDFKAAKSYKVSLEQAVEKTGLNDAVVSGAAKLDEKDLVIVALDFEFIGGSMGSVAGEKIVRAVEKAGSERKPLVIVSTSGGARMQEGMLSLLQMAKTSAAIGRLQEQAVPYISILTNPTSGGVLASFSMLADVIIAEPGAFIGFSGPRVIEQTIKQKLPKGFQTAEFLSEHGMIDLVVPRPQMRETVARLLDFLS
jgi:acetyl-CoA carboxylase carboxyl transferase subunit beta